jgi:CRISPR-associated exonuclease Cas4
MVLFAAVTLLCAVVAWALWTQRQARQALRDAQLPAGELVSIDTQRANLETLKQQNLYSARYGLSGRPDRIMRTPRGIVPVELKSSAAPRTGPHEAQLAQLFAYCLLLEEHYQSTVREGIIEYSDRAFTIPFDDQGRKWILALIAEVREAKRLQAEPGRSHRHAGRCRACGFRDGCSEAL